MAAISKTLREELRQVEFSEGYAESFLDAHIATQIKVLREENQWTQAKLAERIETTQTVISRIENVNYSGWNISTLKRIARAFRVRLKVSFETYGSLIRDVEGFDRASLRRAPREKDPELYADPPLSTVSVVKKHGKLIGFDEHGGQRTPEPQTTSFASNGEQFGALQQNRPAGNITADLAPRMGMGCESGNCFMGGISA